MLTSANVLIFTSILLAALWVWGCARAGGAELPASGAPEPGGRPAVRRAAQGAAMAATLIAIPLLVVRSPVDWFGGTPPRFVFFMLYIAVLAPLAIAFSPLGARVARSTPWWGLVGFQSFRILAETALALGHAEGLAPPQLTFHGWNYDIVTGVSALLLAGYLRRRDAPRLVTAWNWMGLGFLGVIAFIAATSMPTPLRLFMNEPDNSWVTRSPYVLLPGVLVVSAIAGHWLIFRKLSALRQSCDSARL